MSNTKWVMVRTGIHVLVDRFSSVFAGTLPLEHLHRVWDLFLYEGRVQSLVFVSLVTNN